MKGERRRQLNKKIKSIDIPQGGILGKGLFFNTKNEAITVHKIVHMQI